jgi:hypothetical protein
MKISVAREIYRITQKIDKQNSKMCAGKPRIQPLLIEKATLRYLIDPKFG